MKRLNTYITEYIIKKKLDKPIDSEDHYEYYPKSKEELIKNILEVFNSGKTDLNCIDTSKITDMSNLFDSGNYNKSLDNIDISKWNVSNVKYIARMFINCLHFDCDFSNWNIHNVRSTFGLFWNCGNFKGKGLENWDVSNVINMDSMFAFCTKFNCNLSKWNVSTNTTDMGAMFRNCYNFDSDLSNWDVSNVKHMDEMFVNCSKFKGKGLENWDVSNIEPTNMSDMFDNCKSLKKPSWYNGNT